jgi:hypothetical protein
MEGQIFPISFKSGIKRDLPVMQNSYCTDGDWVRFFYGFPQSMGGITYFRPNNENNFNINDNSCKIVNFEKNLLLLYKSVPLDANNSFLKIADVNNNNVVFKNNVAELNFQNLIITSIFPIKPNLCGVVAIQNNTNTVIRVVNTKNPLNNIIPGSEYTLNNNIITNVCVSQNTMLFSIQNNIYWIFLEELNNSIKLDANKGMQRVFNNNGTYREDSGQKSIAFTNNIVKMTEIRGGSLKPTLVIWTTGSLERITNIQDGTIDDGKIDIIFKYETVSNDISVIGDNQKAIIEHEGLFYWIGEQKFFWLNGVVLTLENNVSKQYFFDNLNYQRLDLIYSFKNLKFNEICWAYPSKDSNICDRVITYNIVDDTWYDTSFDSISGQNLYFIAKRKSKYNDAGDDVFKLCKLLNTEGGQLDLSEAANNQYRKIKSFIRTPIYSFRLSNGLDKLLSINRIEPNIYWNNVVGANEQDSSMYMTINKHVVIFQEQESTPQLNISFDNKLIDYFTQARYISFTFVNEGKGFKMGQSLFTATYGDSN